MTPTQTGELISAGCTVLMSLAAYLKSITTHRITQHLGVHLAGHLKEHREARVTSIISYDSANFSLIPANAGAILPYNADSAFPTADGQTDRFPNARFRWITTSNNSNSYLTASIFDVERGAITVSELRSHVAARNAYRPDDTAIVYCSRDSVGQVSQALIGERWHLFLATLDGSQPRSWNGIPTIAVQFTDHNNEFDLSVWWDETNLHPGPA